MSATIGIRDEPPTSSTRLVADALQAAARQERVTAVPQQRTGEVPSWARVRVITDRCTSWATTRRRLRVGQFVLAFGGQHQGL